MINEHSLPVKYPLFLSDFKETSNFLDRFSKNPQISDLMKISPVGAKLLHADRNDAINGRFLQFWEHA